MSQFQFTFIILRRTDTNEYLSSLFNYFIAPFTMSGNKLDIEVRFKIKSTDSNPIDESKQQ
ncbi:MAG: hypothetical protein NTZ35_01900 [Ignavibacteriales bacterium]|nr:hypothetical protein [Ignavibacteriales bacterium]